MDAGFFMVSHASSIPLLVLKVLKSFIYNASVRWASEKQGWYALRRAGTVCRSQYGSLMRPTSSQLLTLRSPGALRTCTRQILYRPESDRRRSAGAGSTLRHNPHCSDARVRLFGPCAVELFEGLGISLPDGLIFTTVRGRMQVRGGGPDTLPLPWAYGSTPASHLPQTSTANGLG